jgi:hypothetical protein
LIAHHLFHSTIVVHVKQKLTGVLANLSINPASQSGQGLRLSVRRWKQAYGTPAPLATAVVLPEMAQMLQLLRHACCRFAAGAYEG